MSELTCNGPCEHTDAEHIAFDQGVAVGLAGGPAEANPYRATPAGDGGPNNPFWRDAWDTGHSAGRLQFLTDPPFGSKETA